MQKVNKTPNKGNILSLLGQAADRAYYPKPAGMVHSFYISGEITSCEEYTDWFDTIRNCGPDDTIMLHINSGGGDLFTAIQFMRVLAETDAKVLASVEGACMSAATMIFLCADTWMISEHSMFMFHNYSGGTIGKGGEMYQQLIHERKWSENLVKGIYKDFLSEEEIISILDNKDIWMDGKEVMKRLNAKFQKKIKVHDAEGKLIKEPVLNKVRSKKQEQKAV